MISLIFTSRPLLPASPHPQHTPFFVPHHSRLTCRGSKNTSLFSEFPSAADDTGSEKERLYRSLFYSLHFDYLACRTSILISLLNGYVCAFLAVRRIAQWDRYRLYSTRTRKTGAGGENSSSFPERMALENWKCFLAPILARSAVCCRMDFPSSIIFSLGFGFHDSSCFWRQPCRRSSVQAGNRISISVNFLGRTEGGEWNKPRQSKCECCVLLSVGLLYDIN